MANNIVKEIANIPKEKILIPQIIELEADMDTYVVYPPITQTNAIFLFPTIHMPVQLHAKYSG